MNLRSLVPCTVLASLTLAFLACGKSPSAATSAKGPGASPALVTVDQRVSYGIGYNVGSSIAREGLVAVDRDALKAGLDDGLSKANTRISEADIRAAFASMQQKAMATAAAEGEKQQAAGKAFLEKNRTRSGVSVTASGLQYEVLKRGSGPKPKATDSVEVHYQGSLIDGTVFDSSIQRGTPATFQVTGVIAGWTEALQLMSVGDKWRLFLPAGLAYGAQGTPNIPPNSTLIFEVELFGIK